LSPNKSDLGEKLENLKSKGRISPKEEKVFGEILRMGSANSTNPLNKRDDKTNSVEFEIFKARSILNKSEKSEPSVNINFNRINKIGTNINILDSEFNKLYIVTNGTVLDYGSGYGNFLYTSNGEFPQENYTAVDVDKQSLNEGKRLFPNANFLHYNALNLVYNPTGVTDRRPMLQDRYYDTIVSYNAVLVVTTIEDMVETINWLFNLLRPGGKMLLTWLDVDNQILKDYYYKKQELLLFASSLLPKHINNFHVIKEELEL
jgi:SAM-dependent methyltransferase